VIAAILSAVWGLEQAPREYGLLLVVTVIGAILMTRKLLRA
jgi:amino acid permease